MANSSLKPNHYSIKEFQLLVKDAPMVPAVTDLPPSNESRV